MMSGRSSRYPFTASQWQELEHQALIFKYMSAGMPIPSDLILHMRRSYLLDSATNTNPTLAFTPQPSLGWGCYQMGFGSRKTEDPEPGRCRRTDGKKWRCSKEAYPDSKYCERHMHRGKNRSRKPVEATTQTPIPTPPSSSPNSSSSTPHPNLSISQPDHTYHLMYPYPSSRPQQLQNNTSHFHLDPASYPNDHKDYRYCQGVKDMGGGEYTFLSPLGAERGSSWELRPLGMNSYDSNTGLSNSKDQEEEKQHCFVLGADFKLAKPVKEEERRREEEEDPQRPLRHFFDEWPQKAKGSWIDIESDRTQLSISMPTMAYHDFPVTNSRYRNDD